MANLTGTARRIKDLKLSVDLWRMCAQRIEDRAAAREALRRSGPATAAEEVKARRRMYNAVARAKAKRAESAVMLRELAQLEDAAAQDLEKELGL